jgi:hypothetical protein
MRSIKAQIYLSIRDGKGGYKKAWDNPAFYSFSVSTTYEEMIQILTQRRFLLPLDDPGLRYEIYLTVINDDNSSSVPRVGKFANFKEGQTLASTQIITDKTILLLCMIYVMTKALPQSKYTSDKASLGWGEVMLTVGNVLVMTATAASIIGGLDVIERRWREWRTTHHTHPQQGTLPLSETDIVAIRLRMTQGPDHEFEEWLTDPDRLKVYIEAFKSSSIKPLQVIFVQRNNKALPVDVLEGAQNNLPLDALLSYLNIDSKQK